GSDAQSEALDAIIKGEMFGTEGAGIYVAWGYVIMQALDAANGYRPNPTEGTMVCDIVLIDTPEAARAYKKITVGQVDFARMSRLLHPKNWDPQWPVRHFVPETLWHKIQGVPKPKGYKIPENYTRAVQAGGYAKIDKMYYNHLSNFPGHEAVA